MSTIFTHYNVLLSCPSDVTKDRLFIEKAIDEINSENAPYYNAHFDIKYWDKDVLFSQGNPQQIINENIVYSADIVIAFFGSKLGTPTKEFPSGSIEEIELMIKNNKHVLVCFSERDITLNSDTNEEFIENILKVKRFKKEYNGLYITYKTESELIDKLKQQLRLYLSKTKNHNLKNASTSLPIHFIEEQITYHFLVDAKEIIFCARTGKSFLNGHYSHIKEAIKNGCKIKFITSEILDLLYDDYNEHIENMHNSLRFIKNMYRCNSENVECKQLSIPSNLTMLYVKTKDNEELIDVKFNFQTPVNFRHPMLRIDKTNRCFNIFYNELINLWELGEILNLEETNNENSY